MTITTGADSTGAHRLAHDRPPSDELPPGTRWLAVGSFALGTEAFVIAGVLPQISDDLSVSLSSAGLLVASFAIAYGVSAPFVSSAVASLQPKTVLRWAMVLFVVTNLAAAAAPTFVLLLVARVLAGVVAATFAPTAAAAATALVDPARHGQALALILGGMSLAMVTGVPLGTILSNIGSWRTTFVFVAILGFVAGIGIRRHVPDVNRPAPSPPQRPFEVLSRPGVARCLMVCVIARCGDFAVFTYLADIVTDLYRWPAVTVPAMLLVNGSVGWFGTRQSGRQTDTHGADPTRRLAIGGSAVGLLTLAVASAIGGPVGATIAVPAMLIWSAAAWAFGPAQQARLLALAPGAPNGVLALNASATQLGIGLGGLVGGVTIAVATSASIPAVGAAFALIGAVVAGAAIPHRRTPTASCASPQDHDARCGDLVG